jgi:hypothetical protein
MTHFCLEFLGWTGELGTKWFREDSVEYDFSSLCLPLDFFLESISLISSGRNLRVKFLKVKLKLVSMTINRFRYNI